MTVHDFAREDQFPGNIIGQMSRYCLNETQDYVRDTLLEEDNGYFEMKITGSSNLTNPVSSVYSRRDSCQKSSGCACVGGKHNFVLGGSWILFRGCVLCARFLFFAM